MKTEKDWAIICKEIISILKGHIQNKLKEEDITEIANKVIQKYLNDFENMKIVYCEDGVKQSVNKKCENECPTGSVNSFISISSNNLCGNNVPTCYENNNAIWYNKVCDEPQTFSANDYAIIEEVTGKAFDATSGGGVILYFYHGGQNQLWFWEDENKTVLVNKRYNNKLMLDSQGM